MRPIALAADVGGTTTRVGALTPDGDIVAMTRTTTPRGADAIVALVAAEFRRLYAEFDLGERVAGVTVGVPGRVDDGVWSTAVNLGVADGYPLAERLTRSVGHPVTARNDVALATVGAAHRHASIERLAYASCGTGLSVGWHDRSTTPPAARFGEVGHVPVPDLGRRCHCGQTGCAESAVGGRAMLDAWRDGGGAEVAHVGEIWSLDHPLAARIRRDCHHALAWIVQLAVVGLGFEQVVIGGGLATLGDVLIEPIRRRLADERVPLLAGYQLDRRVSLADPDIEYGLLGGALDVFSEVPA